MLSLLNVTRPYIYKFKGIRISTRPDYIDEEILDILKSYSVTTIELGAQSMDDVVLSANNRGHSAEDVINSSRLIKSYGFNLGLQMMTGLYKATPQSDLETAKSFISLKPSCVRIYPTVVLKNTDLHTFYKDNIYDTYSLEQSVNLCSKLIMMFYENDINVIRLGLHYSDSLVNNCVVNNYHPAFKDLCETKIFSDMLDENLKGLNKNIEITVNPKSVSKLVGQKRVNLNKLKLMGYSVRISTDNSLKKYDLQIKEQN